MSFKTPTDDTSKPGFVSAIVMKFTNMAQNSMDKSPKEKRLYNQHKEKREANIDSSLKGEVFARGKLFDQSKDICSSGESIALKSTTSLKSTPSLPKDTVKTTIDNCISAEYQVIGEISVKDRIKAFTALQETVKTAANRPDVLNSTKFASPKISNASNHATLHKVPVKNDFEEKLKASDTHNEPINPHVVPKKKITDIISQLHLHKGSSLDGKEPKKSLSSPSRTTSFEKRADTAPTSKPPPKQNLHKPAAIISKTQSEPPLSKYEDNVSSSESSEALTKHESFEYFFNPSEKTLFKSPSTHEDYTMDSSMIDDILAQDDDDDDHFTHPIEIHSRMSNTASKDCLHVDHSNDKRNFILYEPSKNPNYTPFPKSYRPAIDKKGGLKITLPKCRSPSVLKKPNGATKKTKKKIIGFDVDKVTVMETYSMYEYERGDDSIDPLTASAEYEIEKKTEELDKFEVVIHKDDKGLGMSIVGIGLGSDAGSEKLGIYLKALTPGGASEKSKMLCIHDQLLEVDGISLVGVTQSFAAQTLKATTKVVKFLIGREKSASALSS